MFSGQSQTHFRHRPKRRMIGSRKNKSAAESLNAFAQIIRLQVNRDTKRLQNVRTTAAGGNATVAMFHHRRSTCRQNERDRRRDIEQVDAVAPGPANINDWPADASISKGTARSNNTRTKLAISLALSPFSCSTVRKSAFVFASIESESKNAAASCTSNAERSLPPRIFSISAIMPPPHSRRLRRHLAQPLPINHRRNLRRLDFAASAPKNIGIGDRNIFAARCASIAALCSRSRAFSVPCATAMILTLRNSGPPSRQ